jgi:hypothetical protein
MFGVPVGKKNPLDMAGFVSPEACPENASLDKIVCIS